MHPDLPPCQLFMAVRDYFEKVVTLGRNRYSAVISQARLTTGIPRFSESYVSSDECPELRVQGPRACGAEGLGAAMALRSPFTDPAQPPGGS